MTSLSTRVLGRGSDLVLLHGWGLHSGIWNAVAERLAQAFRLTLIDLPGYGCSPSEDLASTGREAGPGEAYLDTTLTGLAEAMPEPATWLGWSLGGMLALALAARFPARVARLVLVAASARFTRAPGWPHAMDPALLERFALDLAQDYEGTLRRFLALQVRGSEHAQETQRRLRRSLLAAGRPHPDALAAGLAILREAELRPALAGIACPVLVVLGERDTLVPAQVGLDLERLAAHVQVSIVPGAGHAPFLSHPEAFVRTVTAFLHA